MAGAGGGGGEDTTSAPKGGAPFSKAPAPTLPSPPRSATRAPVTQLPRIGILFAFLCAAASGAQYVSPDRGFRFDFDESGWGLVGPDKKAIQDVDRALAQRTLVTVQANKPDERYHARFSVVADSLKAFSQTGMERVLAYQSHAVKFLEAQRFRVLGKREVRLPGVDAPALEITAANRDFGLTFRQIVFLRGEDAYLLTAATRTSGFDKLVPTLQKLFDSFRFTGK